MNFNCRTPFSMMIFITLLVIFSLAVFDCNADGGGAQWTQKETEIIYNKLQKLMYIICKLTFENISRQLSYQL